MRVDDISTICRFMGVVEGIAVVLPESVQSMLFDYIEVIDGILNREQAKKEKENGRKEI